MSENYYGHKLLAAMVKIFDTKPALWNTDMMPYMGKIIFVIKKDGGYTQIQDSNHKETSHWEYRSDEIIISPEDIQENIEVNTSNPF